MTSGSSTDISACSHGRHAVMCRNSGVWWMRRLPGPLGLEAEVLHRVGDIDVAAIQPDLVDRPLQQPAGRADERDALAVLLVTRLLADQRDPRGQRTRREHDLGRVLVQLAGGTGSGRGPQLLDGRVRRRVGGRHVGARCSRGRPTPRSAVHPHPDDLRGGLLSRHPQVGGLRAQPLADRLGEPKDERHLLAVRRVGGPYRSNPCAFAWAWVAACARAPAPGRQVEPAASSRSRMPAAGAGSWSCATS